MIPRLMAWTSQLTKLKSASRKAHASWDLLPTRSAALSYEFDMGTHDSYGKAVMRKAAGLAFRERGATVMVSYGTKGGATIDGVVGNSIAVEIESRVSKQVRGALLDLICHTYPKKLLVLVPVHMPNPILCSDQCREILGRFLKPDDYRVVVLAGTGFAGAIETDAETVRTALAHLGFNAGPSGFGV